LFQARLQNTSSINGNGCSGCRRFLVLFEYSGLFEKWLAATKQSDYVLLTGWREVKRCIATLRDCDVTEQPFKIILQCDSPKELYKARTWVQRHSTLRAHHMPDVHVCSSLEPFPSFFAELAQQFYDLVFNCRQGRYTHLRKDQCYQTAKEVMKQLHHFNLMKQWKRPSLDLHGTLGHNKGALGNQQIFRHQLHLSLRNP